MSSNSTLSAENLPEVTQEAPLPSPPLAGASEFSSDNGRSLCIATGDKFKTSSNSDRSTETGSTSPTGSGYSRDEEHTVPEQCDPPITEQELQKEETDARALLRSLPEGVAIVNEREIIVGEEIAINNGCVYSAIWNNRRYVLKLGQANFWDEVQSESNLLEGLKSKDRSRRLFAEWIIRGRFLFKQEIRSVLRCHGLPGIARCVAVLISDEVGVQVKGMIMDSFDKGNLMDVCMSTENLPYAWKVDIALQVARTLELIHARKFIHGDVKCINVLMGDNEDVYLCDFGSAASFGDPPPPDNQMGTGTHMAPELWRGGPKTAATDIFAFGGFLYNLMLQDTRLPYCNLKILEEHYTAGDIFFKEPPKEDWPREWTELLLSCMAADPDDRPSTSAVVLRLSQMAASLEKALDKTSLDMLAICTQ